MTGAFLNALGIMIGGMIGLARTRPMSSQWEQFYKLALGVFTAFYGLRLVWLSLDGSFGKCLAQFGVGLVAMVAGRLLGKLFRLQAGSNRLGQYAKKLIEATRPDSAHRFSNGLTTCALLFCASPLGILGAVVGGLPLEEKGDSYFYPLAVKAVMDGLAMMGFARLFGLGAIVSALPVFLFLALISLSAHLYLEPFLRNHTLVSSVNLAGGLLLSMIALVIFELKKVELADYLPALVMAPLLAAWLLGK